MYSNTATSRVYQLAAKMMPRLLLIAALGQGSVVASMHEFMERWAQAETKISDNDVSVMENIVDAKDRGPLLYWLTTERDQRSTAPPRPSLARSRATYTAHVCGLAPLWCMRLMLTAPNSFHSCRRCMACATGRSSANSPTALSLWKRGTQLWARVTALASVLNPHSHSSTLQPLNSRQCSLQPLCVLKHSGILWMGTFRPLPAGRWRLSKWRVTMGVAPQALLPEEVCAAL